MKSIELRANIYDGSAIAAWDALSTATEHLKPPLHVVTKQLFFFGSSEELFAVVAKLPGEELLCAEVGAERRWVFKLTEGGAVELVYKPGPVSTVECVLYGQHEKLLAYLLEELRESTEQEAKTDVVFAFAPKDNVQSVYRQFDSIPFERIGSNYSERAQAGLRELIVQLSNPSRTGLAVMHGPPGTGKTYAIRSILSELGQTRAGIVCVPPSLFLSRPHLLCEAISHNESTLVILEDVGEMFQEDSKVRFSDQFSALANSTDGLMSLLGNVAFLLTFNYEIGKLDPALIRPGRCLVEVEVPLLSSDEAQGIVGLEQALIHDRSYSLAELYAMKQEAVEHRFAVPKETMGFAGTGLRNAAKPSLKEKGCSPVS